MQQNMNSLSVALVEIFGGFISLFQLVWFIYFSTRAVVCAGFLNGSGLESGEVGRLGKGAITQIDTYSILINVTKSKSTRKPSFVGDVPPFSLIRDFRKQKPAETFPNFR